MIRTKRVYDPPSSSDGTRVLIDRLWPRGLTKERARVDRWAKELAPSAELRTWYGHEPAKYPRFRERYRAELLKQPDLLHELAMESERGPVTLLYAARDSHHCNAEVLEELLRELRARSSRGR